ncbi:LPS export ABC transporter ATP-binding protein [Desulfomonile tiedjei]|uniref:ABC-type (Unclassified) transport system, ATPase component n=1 Tax=Desulfomonile tiedjei (strain ATCC 49306 / DSM 6799 / DCB-1) TaxID=706587 RepID=I4CEX5_DESTA|nr:LPS export ABC transporter ATP-binding protein [Desulfomonile tiedjei]AFM28116.1 ABC-type (unclassified) transport system, ATPase component [Desulfomonile tiedjei DSM 6799]
MRELRARGLVKEYSGRRVVDGVSLKINSGQVVGLLGPNGAGKTTTFYMITGLVRPDSGEVYLDDQDMSQLPVYLRARLGINYLPQETSVFRKLSVADNILAILEMVESDKTRREERLNDLLEELDIAHLRNQRAESLSGGQKRRLEITRALVTQPDFILLDEPFAGLDPIVVLEIQKIIRKLREQGIGIVITDHNTRETLGVCDKIYLLDRGRILEEGDPKTIASSERAREVYLGKQFSM